MIRVTFIISRHLLKMSSAELEKTAPLGFKWKNQNLEKTQFFFAYMLAMVVLVSQSYFWFMEILTENIAIAKVMSRKGKDVNFSKYSLWKILSNFQRCCIADVES